MKTWLKLQRDRAGQMTLEWSLVLAAVALPMFGVIKLGTSALASHYRMVSFLETLPFP